MKMEKCKSVDQRREAVSQFISEHRADLAQQGAVVPTWRRSGHRTAGPYYLLVVRDRVGRQHSVYLGAAAGLVAEVKAELAVLQSPRRKRQQVAHVRRQLCRELAGAKRTLDHELAKVGLKLKGSEIRGWRQHGGAERS